jgi:hypothetical protein
MPEIGQTLECRRILVRLSSQLRPLCALAVGQAVWKPACLLKRLLHPSALRGRGGGCLFNKDSARASKPEEQLS